MERKSLNRLIKVAAKICDDTINNGTRVKTPA